MAVITTTIALTVAAVAQAAIPRPEVHAAYDCGLADRKNATSWLGFGWEYLDVLHFGGKTVAVQRDGAATWTSRVACNPSTNDGEAAIVAHAHARGVRVLLAIHWNNTLGPDALYRFWTDPDAMDTAAAGISARAREAHCDGLSVDFEVANTRFNASFKGLYAGFVRRVSAAARRRNLTAQVVPTVFMDLPTQVGVDGAALAAASSGGVVLMTYDYHWRGDAVAGPNAPLFGNNGSNVNATVAFALGVGMQAPDLLLGIAWYGREWPTVSADYQAATNCSEAVPDQAARAFQAPLALRRARTLGRGERWDDLSQTPWYAFQDPDPARQSYLWWEGYFDDARSLGLKYGLVRSRGLRGVMIWMLNGCTREEAPELWQGLDDAFGKRSLRSVAAV
eukprot:g5925.t1